MKLEQGNGNGTTDLAVLEIETADDVVLRVRVLRDQTYLGSKGRIKCLVKD